MVVTVRRQEKEQLVFDDWAANANSVLLADIGWLELLVYERAARTKLNRFSCVVVLSRQRRVTIEVVSFAVEAVAARLGNRIHDVT